MYSESIADKINSLEAKRSQIHKLILQGWTDKSIANYLATDAKTISRFRLAFNQIGPDVTPEQIIHIAMAPILKYRAVATCGNR
jgi:FixJ family two-component response regulator